MATKGRRITKKQLRVALGTLGDRRGSNLEDICKALCVTLRRVPTPLQVKGAIYRGLQDGTLCTGTSSASRGFSLKGVRGPVVTAKCSKLRRIGCRSSRKRFGGSRNQRRRSRRRGGRRGKKGKGKKKGKKGRRRRRKGKKGKKR